MKPLILTLALVVTSLVLTGCGSMGNPDGAPATTPNSNDSNIGDVNNNILNR